MNISWLWAKSEPYYSLNYHMLDVGFCAQALFLMAENKVVLEQWGNLIGADRNNALALIGYLAALHDWGKAHPYFQLKWKQMPYREQLEADGMLTPVSDAIIRDFRHERYSKALLRKLFRDNCIFSNVSEVLPELVGLHHQGKINAEMDNTIPKRMQKALWEKMQSELEKQMRDAFLPNLSLLNHSCSDVSSFAIILLGAIILSDWICSGMRKDEDQQPSLELAFSWLEKCGLVPDLYLPNVGQIDKLFCWMDRRELRNIQLSAETLTYDDIALMIIEAPMGEGKTETALFAANSICHQQNKNGFYIALPTTATGNQMYHRVNSLFSDHNLGKVRLLHGNAWMVESADQSKTGNSDEEREQRSRWLSPLRKGLLSQYAVGTVDQAMMAVLDAKYSVLRLMGLLDKVLIIDEIHAYDTYMYEIIQRLLEWCRSLHIPVVLLSATLPEEKKSRFLQTNQGSNYVCKNPDYPLITTASWSNEICEIAVPGKPAIQRNYVMNLLRYGNGFSSIAQSAIERVKNGGCCCVLLNTVNRAQQAYSEIKRIAGGDTYVLLFHARFPAESRQQIEDKCTSLFGKTADEDRPKKAILVCTQVMEQSLDVDFDTMITDLAPIDLLLQRMGRVHRFSQTKRPEQLQTPSVSVITGKKPEADCDDDLIYAPVFLLRTLHVLQQKCNIRVPEEIRTLVNTVYSGNIKDDEEIRRWTKQQFENAQSAAIAQMELWGEPDKDTVFFSEQSGHFYLEEDDRPFCRKAKTRLTDDSVRMAFITPEERKQSEEDAFDETIARNILMKSFSIRPSGKWNLSDLPNGVTRGTGLLRGVLLIESKDETFVWGKEKIWHDKDLGILREKTEVVS